MKTIPRCVLVFLLLSAFVGLLFQCRPDPEIPVSEVVTERPTLVGATTAVVGITVTNLSTSALQEIGVCYSAVNSLPTLTNNSLKQPAAVGVLPLTALIEGLQPNTTYYYRVYGITNKGAISYGTVRRFTTGPPDLVAVTLAVVGKPTKSSAEVECRVDNANGVPVAEYGVIFSTNSSLSSTQGATKLLAPGVSGEQVTLLLTSLLAGTTYYYRTFCTDSKGETVYGELLTFKTDLSGLVAYVGNTEGEFYALDAVGGAEIWRYNTGSYIISNPVVDNGIVYASSYNKKLYALDANSGVKRWEFMAGEALASPVIVKGTLYAGSQDGKLYALDPATGVKRWEFATGDKIYGTPFVSNGVVYVGSLDKKLYAIDAVTGIKRWEFLTDSPIRSSPVVVNNMVYISTGSGLLYAMDATSGNKRWEFSTAEGRRSVPLMTSPFVEKGTLYVSSNSGYESLVFAIDAATGSKRWTYTIWGYDFTGPVVDNGTLYVGCYAQFFTIVNGNLGLFVAIDANTGTKKWETVNGSGFGSPVVADELIFTASRERFNQRAAVYGLTLDSGKRLRVLSTTPVNGGSIYGSALITKNGVAIGTYSTDSGASR